MEFLMEISARLEPIFYKLVYMSIIASIIGIIILIIKKVCKNKISSKWISRIWIIFIISLILPVQFKSILSFQNYFPINLEEKMSNLSFSLESLLNIHTKENMMDNFELQYDYEENASNEESETQVTADEPIPDNVRKDFEEQLKVLDKYNPNFLNLLPFIWIEFVAVLLFIYLFTYIYFEIKIHKGKMNDEKIEKILEECKTKLKIKKKIKVIKQDFIKMPSIFGMFNVRILVNENILKLSDKQLEHIFMHELSHYKRKDNILNVIITILRCIYIFNPIIFILLNYLKKDLELSADELAMKDVTDSEEQKDYLKTLVMLSTLNFDKFLIQTLCLTDGKKNLERRIDNVKILNEFNKNKKMIAIVSMILIAVICTVFFTRDSNYMSKKDILKLVDSANKVENYAVEYKVYNSNSFGEAKVITEGKILKKENETFSKTIHIPDNETYSLLPYSYETYTNLITSEQINILSNYENKKGGEIYISLDGRSKTLSESINDLNSFYSDWFDYEYLGEENINDRDAYVCQLISKEQYNVEENEVKKYHFQYKYWIDKETGFILRELTDFGGIIIGSSYIDYFYKFDNISFEEVKRPNLYDYKDYEIMLNYKDFYEEEEKIKENPKNSNEEFWKDFEKAKNLDNSWGYRIHNHLELFEGKYSMYMFFNNFSTNEYYKFIIGYEDDTVYALEKALLDENGKLVTTITKY